MTTSERERFHNLLLMAKESPFEGERSNALEAAERMAQRNDMTLEEAARSGGEGLQKPVEQNPETKPPTAFEQAEAEVAALDRAFAENSRFMRDMEDHAKSDKARRDQALKAAYDRGLDAEERRRTERAASRDKPIRKNGRRRNPLVHAEVLLKETQLPLSEIASICGIDVYTVVGVKLKMRQEATS